MRGACPGGVATWRCAAHAGEGLIAPTQWWARLGRHGDGDRLSPSVLADAVSTSTITATVLDLLDQPVTDGTVVTFTTTLRRLGTGHWVTGTTAGGVVTATLTSGTTPGTR